MGKSFSTFFSAAALLALAAGAENDPAPGRFVPAGENPPATARAAESAVDEVRAAANARTPAEVKEVLTIMERMFAGGSYPAVRQIAHELLENNPALAPLPAGEPLSAAGDDAKAYGDLRRERQQQREKVRFFSARALYEQALLAARGGQSREMINAAAQEFIRLGDNVWGFTKPEFRAAACHYAGRCLEYLTDYPRAIFYMRECAQHEPDAALDVENSIRMARCLQGYAEIIGDDGLARSPLDDIPPAGRSHTRASLLKEAEQELAKIATQHPQNDRRQDIELMLIELRYSLGAYSDVQYQASDYIKRATPGSAEYAKAAYFLANAVYRQGGLDEAAKLFADALEQKITDSRLRGELFLGQGRVNAQMAQTASVEQRQTFLARAQTALRQAVQLLPFGAVWDGAVREFAAVLLELKEYREADKVLQEFLSHAHERPQIVENYYAGLAARGLGDFARARSHMETVIEYCAAGGRELRYALEAVNVLAAIEHAGARPAEALTYYRAGAEAAKFLREYDLYAQSCLGAALAQAELNTFSAASRDAAGARLGDAVLGMLASARAAEPVPLQTAAREVAFRMGALRDWSHAAPENLDKALASLTALRGRMLSRLREDELEFVEGRILFWQAELARRNLRINIKTAAADYTPVLEKYARAAEVAEKAVAANSRGTFAAPARYLLAEILNASAGLRRELAGEFRRRGNGGDAVPLESESEEEYRKALNPLGLAIADAESDTALRVAARTLLGNTYLNLARISKEQSLYYEKGLDALRILVNEPTITGAQKTAAVRGIATALAGGGRIDEAMAMLSPQTARDLPSAMQAAELLRQQDQPRAAYRTLAEGIRHAPAGHPDERESRYALAVLGLNTAADVAPDNDAAAADKLRADSLKQLGTLAEDCAGTDLASRALLAMGEYLIGVKEYDKAVEYAETGLAREGQAVVTAQALHLMEGRAFLAWGRERRDKDLLDKARASFVKAERAAVFDNPLGRRQRAFAVYEQGNVAAALGHEEEALRYYGRVFAIFHLEYEPSDLARLAAAAIHEKHKNYALAWQILDQGFDKAKLLEAKLRVESKYGDLRKRANE